MKNTDIRDIKYLNENVTALYYGSTLVWKRVEEEGGYKPVNNFSGKFTDNSTSKDWVIDINTSRDNMVSIAKYVDSDTKVFDFNIDVEFDSSYPTWNKYKYLFSETPAIEHIYKIPDSDTRVLTQMFYNCSNLLSVNCNGWSTENANVMLSMFYGCGKLTTLSNINWDLGQITNATSAFGGCRSLENISGIINNIKVDMHLGVSPLSVESAMVFINGVVDVGTTRTLTLSSSTFEQLTEEQIAVATSKGWTVAK